MEDPADTGGGGGGGGGVRATSTALSKQVTEIRCPVGARPLRLVEWKVKPGSQVNIDSVLALCVPIPAEREAGDDSSGERLNRSAERKVKSDRAGIVRDLCCQLGQVISPGAVLVRVEECSHPIVMKGLCAECGQDLTQLQNKNGKQQIPFSTASVSMVHSVPELMVSSEQAEQLGREDQHRLHRNKKLVLMVDLDQTLIHTTEQHCQRMSNKGIFHFQLGRGEPMLHTRLRPHCKDFLEKIAKLYELHVFTFGSRLYAHTIAGFLDPEKKLFSHRILSRDECIDPFSKTGNLRNLFPCGDSMVCIIDDREDVWKFAPNLITVKKYIYFQGTGDINAPPGSKEAQVKKKANHVNKSAETSETMTTPKDSLVSSVEERSNGLRNCSKEQNGSKSVSCEKTFTKCDATSSQGKDCDKIQSGKEAAVINTLTDSDRNNECMNVREQNTTLTEQDSIVTVMDNVSGKSGSNDCVTNDLDFDLSSDSENESGTGKNSSDSDPDSTKKFSLSKGEDKEVEEQPSEDKHKDSTEKALPLQADTEQDGLDDLENGCSDKKEAETESQNSEQSELTVGGSLDQSMEEEEVHEDEEVDMDGDDHLIYLEEVLVRIHKEYYSKYDTYLLKESSEMPDIRKIVPELKGKVFAGLTVTFSGLYPTNYPMERTREFYHATALGAKISKHLLLNPKDPNRTTHLIAARPGTEKVRQAQGCKHLCIVNPDWLWACLERWEKVEEQLFPLKEDYVKTQRTNSPATFPEIQGAFQTPLFHPTPIHPKGQPGPEIRTYDAVTGKLIRKGSQSCTQPSYIQPPASLSVHGEQSSFRVVQPYQALGEEALHDSSMDDDQPGPSRRKRQPSMSETMPLYTLCKEDLESMDKEVDDILGEESDNESEGGKAEKFKEDELTPAPKSIPVDNLETATKERHSTPSSEEGSLKDATQRGHKRKRNGAGDEAEHSDSESSKDSSNEDEERSSSEADEMAAAIEAELNDFM
ncbi:RNA polymerase II subunit A C-terminal domain phosphatase [Polypterus senegalus]|uniref:RNA polymerase II subunit A C-terminal domain phosphatase n=1 Tax=Polypterus senegalus TaxID=55291 RepID=UPI001965EC54|nr:RNA polymerase II subunit A C-terminal domain phosphatase [Polypterus senegalus]